MTDHFSKINQIESLVSGGKFRRMMKNPLRYLAAIGYWRLIYPLRKKGKFASARTFFGDEMTVVLPSATEIYLFGAKTHDSEIRLAKFLLKNLKAGDCFIDVGAHFGYFTLLAAKLVGEKGRVHAFEPSRNTLKILQKNTASVHHITLHHRAVSDSEDTLVFHEFPALFSEYNSLVLPTSAADSPAADTPDWLKKNPPEKNEVQGIRLGDFLVKKAIVPKIIKIDVEGAEPQVLRGMEDFFRSETPPLVMEYLIDASQNQAHRWAVIYSEQFGYQPFTIQKDGSLERCHDIEKHMKKAGLDSENIVLKKEE